MSDKRAAEGRGSADGRLMRRSEVPTPALLVDIDLLDRNIATMRDAAKALGVALRPHAKAHKCVEIGQRLVAAGAVGTSCATIGEAEAMALGGLRGILLTAPLASDEALDRLRRLLLRGADVSIIADDPRNVALLASIAAVAGRTLPVIVDLDCGMGRTGCVEIPDAVVVAKAIAAAPTLHYAGLQAYSGNLQQVMPFEERKRLVDVQLARVRLAVEALEAANLSPPSSPAAALAAIASTRRRAFSPRCSPAPICSWIPATERSGRRRRTIPSFLRCSSRRASFPRFALGG